MVVDFPPPVVPPAAREAAKLKIEELSRARALFHSRYNTSSEGAKADGGVLKRLGDLLDQIKELDPYLERDKDLSTLTRLVEQASHDQSISQNKLLRLESDLFDKLEKHANRLEISSMHVEMLEEFFNSELSDVSSVTDRIDNTVLDDDFEVVEKGLESVFENFEKNTFTPKDVDVVAIKKYLDDFFAGEASQNILQHMRTSMANFGSDVMLGREKLDEDTVVWCIEDLLANSLIGDDKRKTLQGYLQSPVALRELTGALNAKSVRHWNYKNVEQGLTVTARQNAEGEYCIAVEEDIIDMLALHTLAVGWSMKLKSVMRQAVCYQEIWGGSNHISIAEQEGIEYWLLGTRYRASSCSKSMPPPPPPPPVVDTIYDYGPIRAGPPPRRRGPVPPPPPPPVGPSPVHYQRKSLKTKRSRIPLSTPPLPPLPPPGPMYIGSDINSERYRNYTRSFFLSRIPKLLGASPDRANASETQALLLKTLVLEAHLRRAFDGSVHGVAANFKSFASSLPHETILTVLEFIGVPDKCLEIFKRYLQVPLNLGPVVRGTGDRILTRTRGVSVGHGLEAFFGEAIMFFLDIAIHRKTGTYLYRLRDKCYFVGSEEQCSTASAEISRFAATMGLEVTPKKMIEEPIGFVNITASGQTVSHALDTARVRSYALRVRQCLSKCSTIIEWIRTWNVTVGTFAAHLFGPLANVFGKEHLKAVTEAYDLMHHIVLQGQDLTSHVQALLRAHLKRDPHDRPVPPSYLEALIYLPHAYGGLGLKNPYNTLSLAREVHDAPMEEIKRYLDSEHKYYDTAKQTFERMTPAQKAEKLFNIFEDDKDRIEASLGASVDPTVFPPLEVITAHRERFTYYSIPLPPISVVSGHVYSDPPNLAKTYFTLLYEPRDYISGNDKLRDEVESLGGKLGMKEWADLSGEDRWTLQVYGEECIEAYGRLAVWHGESVPREVLRMVRGEVEDSWDDGMSTSSGGTIMSDA